jgi:bifunctional UDP-N-acetylglucosamine pyrophosphorylase/glucosamine-1-phosphate N-acetyltransferase
MALKIVILAAGEGSRMHSSLPKVLHDLAGQPLLQHVLNTAQALNPQQIYIVYGHKGEQVRAVFPIEDNIHWVEQAEQLGTAHALNQALPLLDDTDHVLVLYGDVPLISENTLTRLITATPKNGIGIVAAEFADPTGLGRVLRDDSGNIMGIVEHRDANEKELQIKEIYSGILTAPVKYLRQWLTQIENNNAQGEYYLTDVIKVAVNTKYPVIAVLARNPREVEGANDRFQLAELERSYQLQAAHEIMRQGANLKDPRRFDLRGKLSVAEDVVIDINVLIRGEVKIGRNSYIGPNCILKDCVIGDNVVIKANTMIDQSVVGNSTTLGPFARIRPGTQLAENAQIGNFVEIKKSHIGAGSKINHLSYVGDAMVGSQVNIGAGTITCNYDGANKWQTKIGDNAFIGSDTQLIAPVEVGEGATIGAGTTLYKNAPANQLTLNKREQQVVEGWRRPQVRIQPTSTLKE